MREHAPDAAQRHVFDGDEAVLDRVLLLADDGQLGAEQQVVGLVDPARRGVLDRQHRVVGPPLVDGMHRFGEGLRADELQTILPACEVLARGEVAVGALDALDRDTHPIRLGIALNLPLLEADRVVDDLAEDAGDEVGVQTAAAAGLDEIGEQLLLALLVAQRRVLGALRLGDLAAQLAPLGEQAEDLGVGAADLHPHVADRPSVRFLRFRFHPFTSTVQPKGRPSRHAESP